MAQKYTKQLSSQSQADRPGEKTQFRCMETDRRAWGVVLRKAWRPLSVHTQHGVGHSRHCWHMHQGMTQKHSFWVLSLAWTGHGQEYAAVCSPVGALQLCPLHTEAWSQIWGGQILGEVCHRASPGPRQQHSHLNSCSHSLALGQVWDKHNGGRDATLGCFWVELWTPAKMAQMFTVTI